MENFGKAAALDTHKALVHIFFAQRSTKRIKGVTDAGLKPRPIKRLAVLGGGLMGSGIATAALMAGLEVTIKEINQKFLDVSFVPLCTRALNRSSLMLLGAGRLISFDEYLVTGPLELSRKW